MKPLLVQLPDDIYEQLRTKSSKEKTTMREIVTEALTVYTFGQPQKETEKGSENTEKTPLKEKLLNLVIEKKESMLFEV